MTTGKSACTPFFKSIFFFLCLNTPIKRETRGENVDGYIVINLSINLPRVRGSETGVVQFLALVQPEAAEPGLI